MSQILLQDVSVSYGCQRALEEVSVSFEDDVTTAIVGPSGGGKSTLLQLINGVVRPSEGRVFVFGKPVDYGSLPALRRQIGYAVQGTGLFPHLTVEQNITLLAQLGKWDKGRLRARAGELMALVGLRRDYGGRYPHELSGGEQQRVGLCRAMMLRPPIVLLDEPFGALDPVTRSEIHREFLRLQRQEARTIVLVTHDLGEAFKLAQRVVMLDRGTVLQHGTREEIVGNPANDFVRAFCEVGSVSPDGF
jgi:osmoprotectant transport system ATP-binding protein